MNRLFLLVLLLPTLALAQTTQPTVARPTTADHVVIISIDGCRPDLLLLANCPNIRSLIHDGSYTFWARTTAVALTLPSHVSMLTGVVPVRHGIHWNEDLPFSKPYWPKVPTLFELAHRMHYTTAIVAAKSKMEVLNKPGTVDWCLIPKDADSTDATLTMEQTSQKKSVGDDASTTDQALAVIKDHHPDVMFIHLASVDVAGHGKGWGSPAQLAAIENADACVGKIIATIDAENLRARTAILVTSDHGGAAITHGADDPRSRHVPWIISGPGIRKNYDLTRLADLEIETYDTFSTACYLLAIPAPKITNGKPIKEILENRELLGASSK